MLTAFFDIGDTLGTPIFSAIDGHLENFAIYPEARTVLEELNQYSLRMGIISNRGDEPVEVVNAALKRCGLYDFFDPILILYEKKILLSHSRKRP